MTLVTDAWIPLLIGGTLLLVGFAASLVFERYRVPDFFMLLLLGAVLGGIPFPPFGPSLVSSLEPFLPMFIELTLALLLFSGGLNLTMRNVDQIPKGLLKHTLTTVTVTAILLGLLAKFVLGLSDGTALILAAAFAGPSVTILRSFAPQLKIRDETVDAIAHEGILAGVISAVVVLFAVRMPAAIEATGFLPFVSQTVLAASFGFLVGFAWRAVTAGTLAYKFQYIATLALAIVVFAVAEGIVGGNGLIAVFVLGAVMSRRTDLDVEGAGFKAFQGEIMFGLRAFFFVYLGLLFQFAWFDPAVLVAAALLTAGLFAGRLPTSFLFGHEAGYTRRETRAVAATVGRGLTQAVLVLFAVGSRVLPPTEEPFVLGLLPLVILFSAIACAGLVAWAERGSLELASDGSARKDIYRM